MKHTRSLTLKIYISKLKDNNILSSIYGHKKRNENEITINNKPKINLKENQFSLELLMKLKYQCKLYDKPNIILLREEINLIEDFMNNTLKL